MEGETKPTKLSLKSWSCGASNFEIDVQTCDLWRAGLLKDFAKEKSFSVSDLRTMCGNIQVISGSLFSSRIF